MTRRQFIIQSFADYYGIEKEDNELYRMDSYDFEFGTRLNNSGWLNLKRAVYCTEHFFDEIGDSPITEDTVSNYVCDYFDVEGDKDSYEYQAGCYLNHNWLSIETIVDCIEDRLVPERWYMQSLSDKNMELDDYER